MTDGAVPLNLNLEPGDRIMTSGLTVLMRHCRFIDENPPVQAAAAKLETGHAFRVWIPPLAHLEGDNESFICSDAGNNLSLYR